MTLQRHLQQAFNVQVGPKKNGFSGAVGGNSAEAYYKIQLNRSSHLGIDLSGKGQDVGLALLNRNGQVLHRSARKGQSVEAIYQRMDKGTYYLRVSRQGGQTNYRLDLLAAPLNTAARRNQLVQQVVRLVNNVRERSGLAPLRTNAKLAKAARLHSRDMARNDFFSHTSPTGSNAGDRVQSVGYAFSNVGENLAAGQANAQQVFRAWMDSPSHRASILNPNFREIGIGYEFLFRDRGSVNHNYYWTMKLGNPMA